MDQLARVNQGGNIQETELAQSREILELFSGLQKITAEGSSSLSVSRLHPQCMDLMPQDMCFYQIQQLSHDKEYPHKEAFENVLLSLDDPRYNFVYILTGTKEGVDLSIGVVKNQDASAGKQTDSHERLSAVNYGDIVAEIFKGNFNGSNLNRLKGENLRMLTSTSICDYSSAGVIRGIPSVWKSDGNNGAEFQGIDRLINSMLGLEWRLVIVCEPVDKMEIQQVQDSVYQIYNQLFMYAKQTRQKGVNRGVNQSESENFSDTKGENQNYNISDSHTQGQSSGSSSGEHSQSKESSSTHQEGRGEGKSWSHTAGRGKSKGLSWGESSSITIELANKKAQELMKYIDEELLERLRTGFSRGLFKTSVYYMAKTPVQANRLKSGILSLFQGDQVSYSPLRAHRVELDPVLGGKSLVGGYQNRYLRTNDNFDRALTLMGIPFKDGLEGLQTYLTAGEISLLAGLPQKEVPGLPMKESVDFGLNLKSPPKNSKNDKGSQLSAEESIKLGNMIQQGRKLENVPFLLSRESLSKHTFIAGVTGSGKTTTCHRLLREAKTPFLVLEPAKTEYRILLEQYPDMVVFTLGNESAAPFRINPFELVNGEVLSAHIDMVKATFTSAFPMEGSMPQLLEEAIYLCYERLGWKITEKYKKDSQENPPRFPVLSDLIEALRMVVREKKFGGRLESEYLGSLVSRLSNLTKGVKGLMLNCQTSTDFDYIAENCVVMEMEELKAPEDKALFMGFILSRLTSVIRDKHRKNSCFHHITLIEEAHRLLSKVELGDHGAKKAAVETFTDLLAEVRKYGEGLIVVDQIPNKLTPEVLKNTNTKIIHKLLAQDDKEAVGDAMLMDDKQKAYLSALETGQAVIFSEITDKPVHVAIEWASDTNGEEMPDDKIHKRFCDTKEKLGACYQYSIDPELMRKLKDIFEQLNSGKNDQEKFLTAKTELLNHIRLDARKQGRSIEEVWKDLLLWRDILTGKSFVSYRDSEERLEALLKFFTGIFCAPDFSVESLPLDSKFRAYIR